MTMKTKPYMFFLLFALLGCSPQAAPTPTPTAADAVETNVITIADISSKEPTSVIEEFQPFIDYVASKLEGDFIGEVKVAPDMQTMGEWMQSGEVDLYFDSPYPALVVSEASGGIPILRRWKDNVSDYTTVIFTLAENDIETLDDLKGGMIAFDEPESTSGYMMPLAHLIEAGYTVTEKESNEAGVAAEEIGYVFSDDDDNSVQWVVSGLVEAAAIDNASFNEMPEETRSQFQIIAETGALPRQVVVIGGGLDTELRGEITNVLTAMDEDEVGKALLLEFDDTARFDEFPGGAETALARMREIFRLVTEQ